MFIKNRVIIKRENVYVQVEKTKKLDGLVTIVTGATGSIGSAISRRFASEGATVILAGRNEEKLKQVKDSLLNVSDTIDYRIMNIDNETSIEVACRSVAEQYGSIDILVNNAGFSARGKHLPLHEQDISIIDGILQTNLRGVLLTSGAVVRYMQGSSNGRIINVASVVGVQGKKNHAEYSAAKAGVIGMTKTQAIEVGKYGITVNCVSPGLVPREDASNEKLTEFIQTNRLGLICSPDDIANAVMFLASPESRFITGQNICVDGGRSIGLYGDK